MTEDEKQVLVGVTQIAGATSLLVKATMQILNTQFPHFKISLNHQLDDIVVTEPYGEAIVEQARLWVTDLENAS